MMHKCEQTKGLSVYQHGLMVQEYALDLLGYLYEDHLVKDFKIPNWLVKYKDQIGNSLYDREIIDFYTLYHDIGKPYCLTVDSDGKRHFPDHANVSKQVWLSISDDLIVGDLIGDDMIIHTATAEEINMYMSKRDIKHMLTLLIVSLAEIHANASMFGGLDSVSFKMKYKKIEQRGNQICRHYFDK